MLDQLNSLNIIIGLRIKMNVIDAITKLQNKVAYIEYFLTKRSDALTNPPIPSPPANIISVLRETAPVKLNAGKTPRLESMPVKPTSRLAFVYLENFSFASKLDNPANIQG